MLSLRETEDPEYSLSESVELDKASFSVDRLQLLLAELDSLRMARADDQLMFQCVCDYVVHDPIYADSTRAWFVINAPQKRPIRIGLFSDVDGA